MPERRTDQLEALDKQLENILTRLHEGVGVYVLGVVRAGESLETAKPLIDAVLRDVVVLQAYGMGFHAGAGVGGTSPKLPELTSHVAKLPGVDQFLDLRVINSEG